MKIKASSFTLNKRGTLEFDADDLTANQCGTEKHRIFEYVVRIKVMPNLDADGYTVEHNALEKRIKDDTSTGSCEEIAKNIVDVVFHFFQEAALYLPLKIYVKVYPKTFPVGNAFMEYEEEYEYGDARNPDHEDNDEVNLADLPVCEKHPNRFWPHANPDGADCLGPGMWLPSAHPMYAKPAYLGDEEWVLIHELRSGAWKQAKGFLHQSCIGGYCCLGVACITYQARTGIGKWVGDTFGAGGDESAVHLPHPVQRFIGWRQNSGLLEFADRAGCPMWLTTCNDPLGLNFNQIADVIQAGLVVRG